MLIPDAVPHGANFSNKGISGVGNCIRCGFKEDDLHVLKNCSWAQKVWKLLPNVPMNIDISCYSKNCYYAGL